MQHLQILFLILNLIAGIAIIVYSHQVYKKFRDQNIRTLMYYTISFNVLVFVNLNYKYLMANIFNNQFFEIPGIITLLLLSLVFVAEYAITYYLYRFSLGLLNKKISRQGSNLFIAWLAFFASASLLGMFIYYSNADERWFYIIHMVWIFSMCAIILFTLISLLIKSNRITDHNSRVVLKSFAILFFAGYTLYAFSHINFYLIRVNVDFYDSLILLVINLCPFIWFRYFYFKYHRFNLSDNNIDSIHKFADAFKLTSREKTIVELIMKGKTNSEIETSLFISFNTVKNHIYNIYKKAGVNSRSQLQYFIRNFEDQEN